MPGPGLDMTQAFNTNLRALGLLALLVGLFLVYGTMSFAIVQRRRSLGILRALGATRGQLLRIILLEAVGLALVGGAAGLAAGVLIGGALVGMVSRTINDLYYVVAVNSVTLPAGEPLLAIGAALAVALLAAAVPALEATHSAPQLTLRASVLEQRARRVALGALGVSALLAVACLVTVMSTQRSVLAGFGALVLVMLSVAAATPAVLYGAATVLAGSRVFSSPPARLALGGIAGSLSRTGVAVAALAMAVAAMIGISIMVDSFRESLRDWLSHTLQADIYVGAPGPGFARPERRLDAAVMADLVRVTGCGWLQREPPRHCRFESRTGGAGCHGQHTGHARRCRSDRFRGQRLEWLRGRRGAAGTTFGLSPEPDCRRGCATDDGAGAAWLSCRRSVS